MYPNLSNTGTICAFSVKRDVPLWRTARNRCDLENVFGFWFFTRLLYIMPRWLLPPAPACSESFDCYKYTLAGYPTASLFDYFDVLLNGYADTIENHPDNRAGVLT